MTTPLIDAPADGWRTVEIDPPWPERGGGKIKRGADRHYAVVGVRHIPGLILGCGHWRLAEHAHVYMWATNNYLMRAGWVLEQLGLRYVTTVTWPKTRAGLGQYFRGRTEHLLFAVRGRGLHPSVCTGRRDLSTLLAGAEHSRVHSRKPDAARQLIEARSHGPYLELFADPSAPERPGWTRWGLPRHPI